MSEDDCIRFTGYVLKAIFVVEAISCVLLIGSAICLGAHLNAVAR